MRTYNIPAMLKKIYSIMGHGACIIKDGKISVFYLLSDEEIDLISKFAPVTLSLPADFKLGVFEDKDGKVVILKSPEGFVAFPTRRENVMELIKEVEVKVYDQILSP